METTIVQGYVNVLTGTYKNGAPKVEIRVPLSRAKGLPYEMGERVPVMLKIGKRYFKGKLHASPGTDFVYFSAILTAANKEFRLGKVLAKLGVKPKDRLQLHVRGRRLQVRDKWGNGLHTSASRINRQITDEPKTLTEIRVGAGVTAARYYSHMRSLRRKELVKRLDDGRYIAAENQPAIPEGTIVQRILKAVAALLIDDLTKKFSRRDVRVQLGLSQDAWVRSHSPLFQGMRSDHPGGAPHVAQAYRDVFRRLSQGVYVLTEKGQAVVQGFLPLADDGPGSKGGGCGAGFGSSEDNKLVEDAARTAVTAMYAKDGWTVKSVEQRKGCGYDLECRKGKLEEEHVEFKGVAGPEQSFAITAGEVQAAKNDPQWCLCVVTSALSPEKRKVTKYTAEEFLVCFDLKTIQYMAKLGR